MKTLRQLLVASVVTFAFITPAFAGQIDTMIAPPPPPAATMGGEIETTRAGEIQIPGSEASVGGSAAVVALSLLQSAVSLF